MSVITNYICDHCYKDCFKEKELTKFLYAGDSTNSCDLCFECIKNLLNICLSNNKIFVKKYCFTCKGTGKIKIVVAYANCSYDTTEYEYKSCPDCEVKNG